MKRKKKKMVLVGIMLVVVLYITVLLVDYVNMFKLAKKPLFAIEASKEEAVTYNSCYDYKYEGLGYNYYTRECYDINHKKFEIDYVKLTIFDQEIRKGWYGITL